MTSPPHDATDGAAVHRRFQAVYPRLLERARMLMSGERVDHTLEPSALVHEVFLRLSRSAQVAWRSERHFEALAARSMRQVLVDHAKRRRRDKRGSGAARITLSEAHVAGPGMTRVVDLLALDDALERLRQLDERAADVLELRLFSSMTVREVAAALDLSYDVAKEDWLHARAWLARELQR